MTDVRRLPRSERRAAVKFLEKERLTWPTALIQVPENQWPQRPPEMKRRMPVEIWRSSTFLLQVFHVSEAMERLSINRTQITHSGNWRQDISWDELQSLKNQCGRGNLDAVEVFPAGDDVINVANMRHLWVFKAERLGFAWRKGDD